MRRLPALVAAACLAASSSAFAGPLEGELFGYKLGSKYPVTAKTQGYFMGLGQWVITAEKPEKPKEFSAVELIATLKSYTIGNIYAKAEFPDEAKAKALANKYGDLLNTLYAGKCQPLDKVLEETVRMRCGLYELSVNHFKPSKPEDMHSVHVGLSYFRDEGPVWKSMKSLFETEFEQLDKESKQLRLEKARKDQSLRGLQ